MAASLDSRRPGSKAANSADGSRPASGIRGSQLPDVNRRTPQTYGAGTYAAPQISYVSGFNKTIEVGQSSTPNLRRLPDLGQALSGCRSSPNMDIGRRSRPGSAVPDAATTAPMISPFATASAGAQKAAPRWGARRELLVNEKLKIGNASKPQGMTMPASRAHRDEVLEKDRQRQRDLCGWDQQRNFASPARSRVASLFFDGVPGADSASSMLPEPFKQVARPRTRQMPVRTAASIDTGADGAGTSSGSKQPPKGSEGDKFDNADLAFDQQEMADLIAVFDHFATTIRPPGKEVDPLQALQLVTGSTELKRELGQNLDMGSMDVVRELERQGPLILRPMYCRFLLASKLCGQGPESMYKFHELVAAFDEKSCVYGSFPGMSRANLCCLLAKLLVPAPPPGEKKVVAVAPDAPKDENLVHFFSTILPTIKKDTDERRKRLDNLFKRTPAVESKEVPPSILEEVTLESLWPPLPPRGITQVELPGYLTGVRQWEDELGNQSAFRLTALRAHTEAVVRGEMICSQLLEPEVLHFATRFRPLFKTLFTAYYDAPSPEPASLLPRTRSKMEVHPELGPNKKVVDSGEDQHAIGLGHMSFVAFFRFCVDFGLFPQHANFEEIVSVYSDSECVRRLPSPDDLLFNRLMEESQEQAKADADKQKRPRRPSAQSDTNSKASSKPGSRMGSRPQTSDGKAPKRSKKLEEVITKATAAAIVHVELSMPKADLRFFERPMALMSPFEIKTLSFFAAIDEWLGERFCRLPDVKVKTDEDEADVQQAQDELKKVTVNAAMYAANLDEKGEWIPDPEARSMREDEARIAVKAAMKLAQSGAECALSSLSRAIQVTPQGLLDVIAPLKAVYKPGKEEATQMFRLLLAGPDENGHYGEAEEAPGSKPPTMPVFQLDKVLRKAADTIEKARRWSCALMSTASERTLAEKECFDFFEAISDKLFENSKWMDGEVEDIFADVVELTPEVLISKARSLGIPDDLHPKQEDLAHLLVEVVGRREATMDRSLGYRAIALMLEGRYREQHKKLNNRLQCQTHSSMETLRQAEGPKEVVFGLAAFVECLIKLCLHRLGAKGWSDIQRGSPAWWKCTWMLTLLNGKFTEKLTSMRFEKAIFEMAMSNDGSWEDAFADTVGVGMFHYGDKTSSGKHVPRQESLSSIDGLSECSSQDSGTSAGRKSRNSLSTPTGAKKNELVGTPRETASNAGTSDAGASKSGATKSRSHRSKAGKKRKKAKVPQIDKGPNVDAEVWWRKMQSGRILNLVSRNVTPMEWLSYESADMFETANMESAAPKQSTLMASRSIITPAKSSSMPSSGPEHQKELGPCEQCGEKPSPSGWGNPSCVQCGGVESICLPIESHMFCELLNTYLPPPDPLDEMAEEREYQESKTGSRAGSKRTSLDGWVPPKSP